jgi:predicted acylesterase/phospholipase RssA
MQSEYKTSDKQSESFSHCQSSCLESPFEEIALAFSGGGFRAAGFSLGVLSYLDSIILDDASRATLLRNVKYISSTSGGTITASLYTLFNSQGKLFNEAYFKIFDALDEQHLLENALSILNDNAAWKDRPDKSRNLINAFAMTYDTDILFKGATMNDLIGNSSTHLEEVCFNATEFYKGRSFCQQIKLKPDPKNALDKYFYYGGHYAHLGNPTTLDAAVLHLKLADVLAASSCFPAGFEPIIYPNDFTHDTLNKQTLEKVLTLEVDVKN